jgi:hypothetical protein
MEEPMLTAIDLSGASQEIEAILAWAKQRPEVEEASEPTSLDASRALNFGLPDLDPKTVMVFITLAFKAGKSALDFLKALQVYLKSRDSAVAASDSATGKPLGRLDSGTSEADIAKMAAS